MIISVEDKFQNLYSELKNRGYDVYRFSDNVSSDVAIYSGENTRISGYNSPISSFNDGGVFLINGDNMNADEIDRMIKNRTYSSLF